METDEKEGKLSQKPVALLRQWSLAVLACFVLRPYVCICFPAGSTERSTPGSVLGQHALSTNFVA